MKQNTIGQLFLLRTQKSANDKAVGYIKNNQIKFFDYREYRDIIEKYAWALKSHDVVKDTRVAILGQTSKEWHFSDLATLCIGGVVIPVYPSYSAKEIKYILNHSESEVLFVEDEVQLEKILSIKDELPEIRLIISFKEISQKLIDQLPSHTKFQTLTEFANGGAQFKKQSDQNFEQIINEVSENDTSTIIYTSGTTGEPKGALVTQNAFYSMLKNCIVFLDGSFSKDDRTLLFLPLSHVFGRAESMLPLIFGWHMVFAESIERVIENLPLVKPTVMFAVPRIFEKIYNKVMGQVEKKSPVAKKLFYWAEKVCTEYHNKIENDISLTPLDTLQYRLAYKLVFSKVYNRFGGKVRFFISGGAPLSYQINIFMRNANLTILEGYGLTETMAPAFLNPPSRPVPGTVGLPIGDTQIKIAEDGEIYLRGSGLFKEYYKNPDATNSSFTEDGWFMTGDIGKILPSGYLKITDRKKDIIITSAGKNVAPQKIENLLKAKPHVSQAVIVGDQRKYLTALIGIEKESFNDDLEQFGLNEMCGTKDLSENQLIQELIAKEIDEVNAELSRFETIKKYYVVPEEFTVENGFLTPSLKVKKKVIMNKYANQIEQMY